LVAEDEPDLLASVTMVLERVGYVVHGFVNPSLALKHIQEQKCKDCKIVVSDIKMYPMTGVELAIHLKKIHPYLKILIMTAMPVDKEHWREVLPQSENIDAFIPKPFTSSDLLEAVRKLE
jgi:CheY-like chemotaxis protein